MLMTASSIDSDSGSSSGNCASGGNRDAGEPSIPGSSRGPGSGTFPGSVSSVSAKAVSPPPASTAALHSRAVVGAVARAWSDDLQDGSTEDEDEDRRLEAAALGVSLTSVSSVADSPPLASTLVPPMAKKGAMKKVEHSAMASAAARGDKENVKKNDATQWTSNVDKWHMQDAENVLTPRGSKRKHAKKGFESDANHAPRQPLAPLRKSSFKRDNSLNAQQVDVPPASIAIQMDQFSHATVNPPTPMPMMAAPTPLKPSNSIKSTTMRMMERSPLLRAQSSIANDPEWGFRGVSEVRPDVKNEFRSLCELSYPVIFTYVLEFLPGIISMTLVGHMDSPKTKEYVGGVSMSTMFMNLTGIAFGFGLATAMDTLCSQAYGAGKPMKMGIYFQCGVLVLGATVIPVFLLNWYTEQFLLMMGQPSEVAQLAGRFSQLILPGIPFLYVYELFKKLLQAQNVVAPMVWIAVISNVVNVVLGVHLTWYTSLGYDGAAIARTIANIVLPGALIPYFMWNPDVVRQWWPGWKLSQAVRHLKTFLTLGIPGMFMMLLEWWAFEIMAAFVGLLPNSVVAISVHSVLSNVSTMAFNFFLGIGVATNIRVGNYVGSNQPEHAKMASVLGMVLSLVVSAALAVVILVTRNVLPMVFINDPLSVTLAAHAFLFLMPYQMLDAVNSVMQGVFRGTGRQKLGAYINLFGYFVIGLPFGVFLAFQCGYGVEGLWLGLTSGIGVAGVMALYKIYYIDWDELADEARVLAT